MPCPRRPQSLLLVLLGLLACNKEAPDSGPQPDSGQPPDGAEPSYVLVESSEEELEAYGYVLREYERDASSGLPYESLFGGAPRFWLIGPEDLDAGPRPVLMRFHGGGLGDDSSGSADKCVLEEITNSVGLVLAAFDTASRLAMEAGWVMVVPRYDWCDGGMGLGADDPGDPEHHWGHVHTRDVLDFVLDGGAGFEPSGPLYGIGYSMGGVNGLFTASRYPGFSGLVVDSSPSSMLEFWSVAHYEDDPSVAEHVFGGPPYDEQGQPTEHWEALAAASGEVLVAEDTVSVPLLNLWNSLDQVCPDEHAQALSAALEAAYTPLDRRWASHDLQRPFPSDSFHLQSHTTDPPAGYLGYVSFRFLEGARPVWQEAEAGCAGSASVVCDVGVPFLSGDDLTLAGFSGGGGLEVQTQDGEGRLWCGSLPEEIVAGQDMTALFVLKASGPGGLADDDVLARASWLEAGEEQAGADFLAGSFSPGGDGEASVAQFHATQLGFAPGAPDEGRLCLDVTGLANLQLDAVVYLSP